jgi:riboflavin kinase/FMN adenylyltransferase
MRMIEATGQATLLGSVVAVGSFDGVHRGHRELLRALRRIGIKAGLKTALVSFDPIPRAVIFPESAPPLICSVQTRLRLLAQTGDVDHCCVLPFDERMRNETVEDFIAKLIDRLGMRILVVGENFACGRGRKGNVAYLSELGVRYKFSVEVQALHTPHGLSRCSSTETRRLIRLGEVAQVARLLDRPHEMTGLVLEEAGSQRRNSLQVALDENLCTPPKGDYLGAIRVSGEASPWTGAMLMVGEAIGRGRSIVQLKSAGDLRAKTGDALILRFAQRVASNP